MPIRHPLERLGFVCLLLAALAPPAAAAPDREDARRLFAQAEAICARDGGALWGVSICGPILVVDPTDRAVVANQPDAEGVLTESGDVFVGKLPQSVTIANTPTEWSGVRWTQLLAPLPTETAERHVLLAHELFHRVQDSLGLVLGGLAGNAHLDTLDGRYLLQLEWRALARALTAETAPERTEAISDALAFRHERYRLFPEAGAEEAVLEITEGVPEYTGVRLGLETEEERIAYAVRDLEAFVSAPTFVRAFAYATGPAYGLLLDEASPSWRDALGSGQRLDALLATALDLSALSDVQLDQRAQRYDGGALRASEEEREARRLALQAEYRARLVDGPVLVLPLANSNFQFNPQTLVPLDGLGTVFPTMRLTDDWGSLEVDDGGVLVRGEPRQATVSAAGADAAGSVGDGWRLSLEPGWEVGPGDRPGDLAVHCADACAR